MEQSVNTDFPNIEESICRFVTEHYAQYQGAFLCGKCAEITGYLLNMAGKSFEKVTCTVDGVGHILVKTGDYYIDPSIKQFGNYPELSYGEYPIPGVVLNTVLL